MKNSRELQDAIKERAKNVGLEVGCFGDGAFHSSIAIIGEGPNSNDIAKGKPFVGGSGNLMWTQLRKYNINRASVYSTYMCKRLVSFGQDKTHTLNRQEAEHWTHLLKWELLNLPNLKYLVITGSLALSALYDVTNIVNWRGSVVTVEIGNRTFEALITFNPSRMIKEPKHEITFNRDLAKFNLVVQDKWVVKPITSELNPTCSRALEYLDYLGNSDEPVAYDIEVISQETACIGLTDNASDGMCIPFRLIDTEIYNIYEEMKIRRALNAFLRKPKVRLIAQNNMFDASWLAFKDRIVPQPAYGDTMLAHHLLYPQLPHNLGYITTQYTSRPFYKDEGKDWKEGGDIDKFWHYCVQDGCNTWEAHKKMLVELRAQGLYDFYFNHVMRLQPHLIRMTVGGVLMDLDHQADVQQELETAITKLTANFDKLVQEVTNDPERYVNPRSPAQLSKLLFSDLKLIGRGASTDKQNRDNMYKHPATTEPKRKILKAIDSLAEEQKFYSTYAMMRTDPDGRIRCEYKQTGVQSAPGRLSSSGMLWGTGMNLQNQPRRAQSMFIADPNYCLIYFDLAQAEARLVAWYANIESWKAQFEKARLEGGYDAHRALAADMWGIDYDDVPTSDYDSSGKHTIRYTAKRCRHGLNYRMAPDRLAQTAGLTLLEATKAYNIYHRLTPELARWWDDLGKEITQHGMMYNALGRRFILLERKTPKALDAIVAFKPQSTNGDHTARVIYLSECDDDWHPSGRMLLNIHDANIAMVRKEHAMKSLAIMKKYAEKPLIINGEELIIPADLKISVPDEENNHYHRWSTLKGMEL